MIGMANQSKHYGGTFSFALLVCSFWTKLALSNGQSLMNIKIPSKTIDSKPSMNWANIWMSMRWKMIRYVHTTFSWKVVNLSMESSYLLLLLFWDDDVLDLNAAKNPFLGVAVAVVESVVSAFWPKLLLPLLSFFIFLSQLILYTLYYFCATLISIWQCFKNS